MVAVVDSGFCPPEQRGSAPVLHRVVAVALAPAQLRRDSPLAARLAGVGQVDLLVLTDGDDAITDDDPDGDDPDGDDLPDPGAVLRAAVAAMGIAGLALHRLALSVPLRLRHVDDIVAAISELVGFDPEPGVGCVVPAGARHDADGSADLVVARAVERIVAVYRLPLLAYQPLEP